MTSNVRANDSLSGLLSSLRQPPPSRGNADARFRYFWTAPSEIEGIRTNVIGAECGECKSSPRKNCGVPRRPLLDGCPVRSSHPSVRRIDGVGRGCADANVRHSSVRVLTTEEVGSGSRDGFQSRPERLIFLALRAARHAARPTSVPRYDAAMSTMPTVTRGRLRWRERLHEVTFESDTAAGRAFDLALLIAILVSVAAVLLESVSEIRQRHGQILRVVEWMLTIAFTIEYVLRLVAVDRPWRYAELLRLGRQARGSHELRGLGARPRPGDRPPDSRPGGTERGPSSRGRGGHLLQQPPALACKIDRLLGDPARLAAMRANARRLAWPHAARDIAMALLDAERTPNADNLCLVPASSLSSLSAQQGRSPGEPDAVWRKTPPPRPRPAGSLSHGLAEGKDGGSSSCALQG
jgi:hypothetical protein